MNSVSPNKFGAFKHYLNSILFDILFTIEVIYNRHIIQKINSVVDSKNKQIIRHSYNVTHADCRLQIADAVTKICQLGTWKGDFKT